MPRLPSLATIALILVPLPAAAATVPAEAVVIEGEAQPELGDPSLTITDVFFSGTTPTGESVVAARRSNLGHALTVGGQTVWQGNSGNNPQFNLTGVVPAVRSADVFAAHVREPDLPSYGYRVETAAGILATETLPITELDGLVPDDIVALKWASDDELLMVVYASSQGILLSSDGTPGTMQRVLGPGDVIDGRTIGSIREEIDASGTHRIVRFHDTDDVEHLLVDDTVVIDEDADIPGMDLPWGTIDAVSIAGTGRYAFGGGHPLYDVLQYVAVDGEIVVTADQTIDEVDLAGANIMRVELDDDGRMVYHWRYPDPDDEPEALMYTCNAGAAGTQSHVLLQTGDVIEIQGEPGGTITVEGFAEQYQGDMLGDPNAIVVQVEGQRNGESVDASVRVAVECCGNGNTDPSEACDDANDVETDACLSTCEAASCGDGFVHDGVEACDDGNTANGDGCSSTCEIEEDDSGDDGLDDGGTDGDGDGGSDGNDGDDGPGGDDDDDDDAGSEGGGDESGGDGGATDSGGGCSVGGSGVGDWWLGLFGLVLIARFRTRPAAARSRCSRPSCGPRARRCRRTSRTPAAPRRPSCGR